jgi:trigger factor
MKVESKKVSKTHADLTVTLDKDDLAPAEAEAIERLAKNVKVQGFRKGKAPAAIARPYISDRDLIDTTLDIAVRTSVPHAFEQAKLVPVEHPHLEITKYVPGDLVEYTTSVDIFPDIKVGAYKKLKVKKPEVKVAAKDINDVLSNIQNAYAEKKVASRAAKDGDEVIIDFTGKKDGKAFDGGSAKDYKLTLGSKSFIPGFEEGIVGHEVGDSFDLNLTFPKDYHVKELAGAKVVFSVLLKQINEIVKPELDDDLAKKCGPFQTIKDLKDDIKKNLESQAKQRADNQYKDDLVDALLKKSTVDAPEVMIKDQINFIKSDVSRNAASRGLSFEQLLEQTNQKLEDWEKEAREVAIHRVKASLLLQTLAKDESIAPTDAEIDEKLKELQTVYAKDKEALKQLQSEAVRNDLRNRLTIDKTLDFLVKAQ